MFKVVWSFNAFQTFPTFEQFKARDAQFNVQRLSDFQAIQLKGTRYTRMTDWEAQT